MVPAPAIKIVVDFVCLQAAASEKIMSGKQVCSRAKEEVAADTKILFSQRGQAEKKKRSYKYY